MAGSVRSASSRPKINMDINSRCRGTAFDFTMIDVLSRRLEYISINPAIIGWLGHESRSWPIHGSLGGMALSVELRAFRRGPVLLRLVLSPGEDPGQFLGAAGEAYSTARPGRYPR